MREFLISNPGILLIWAVMAAIALYLKWKIYRIDHCGGTSWDNKPWDEEFYQQWVKEFEEEKLKIEKEKLEREKAEQEKL